MSQQNIPETVNEQNINEDKFQAALQHIENIRTFINNNIKLINLATMLDYSLFILILAKTYHSKDFANALLSEDIKIVNHIILNLLLDHYLKNNDSEDRNALFDRLDKEYDGINLLEIKNFVHVFCDIQHVEDENDKQQLNQLVDSIDQLSHDELMNILNQ